MTCIHTQHTEMDLDTMLDAYPIQGERIPMLRNTKPYTYLGIDITLTLGWQHQFEKAENKLRERIAAIKRSPANMRVARSMHDMCVMGCLRYSLPLGIYSAKRLQLLEIGRAHVRTPVTEKSRMPSSA